MYFINKNFIPFSYNQSKNYFGKFPEFGQKNKSLINIFLRKFAYVCCSNILFTKWQMRQKKVI